MFAGHYFAARYFAPRYFPEVGADPTVAARGRSFVRRLILSPGYGV